MIRKLFFMLVTFCFLVSCGGDEPLNVEPGDKIEPEQPENPNKPDEPDEPDTPEAKTKHIKMIKVDRPSGLFTEDHLSYDDHGRIIRIESHIENTGWFDLSEYDAVTTFTYLNKEVVNEITCNGYSHKQVIQLNASGYIEKLVYNEKDGLSDTFEYWGDGCLKINTKRGGYYAYQYEDGNLTTVTFVTGDSKGSTDNVEPGDLPNHIGISPILLSGDYNTLSYEFPSELGDADLDIALHNAFYLFYNGLYGKPSKNLETSVTDRGETLSFEYELDKDGYPTKIVCTELDNGTPIPSKESEEAFTASIEYLED